MRGQESLTSFLFLLIVIGVRAIAKLFKVFFGILDSVVGEKRSHRKIQIVERLNVFCDCFLTVSSTVTACGEGSAGLVLDQVKLSSVKQEPNTNRVCP